MVIAEFHPILGWALVLALICLIAVVVICDKNRENNERELKRREPLLP